ncbi:hypothetical protein TNIN_332461 [Trichonephila inaurata madagascariensis]|uniref:Uncharacterized protein n=1 Tax=Trichonephila inaurata madagascariensis TaxID=2747483 RepID=A0A8X7CLH2_9ARAC|nr:hypothetical protein TNIN_332461 [Trichonephila inaurata madagascariensis]
MRWNTVSVGCGAKFRRLIQSDWARGSLPDVTARDLGTSTISYHWLNSSRWQDLESLFPPFRPHLRYNYGFNFLNLFLVSSFVDIKYILEAVDCIL